MATKRIEGSDIVAQGWSNQAIKDALALEQHLDALKGQFQEILAITGQMAKSGSTNNTSGIASISQAYSSAQTSVKGYNDVLAQKARLEEKLIQIESGMANENIALQKTIQQLTAQIKANSDVTSEQIGEYQKAVNQLHKVKRAIMDLHVANKQNTEEAKKLILEYEKLNSTVRGAEQAVGQYQRNVGNYTKGQKSYNYEMFQMQQILREMPNFAMSARIGIMSLSNNLPQLGDAIKKVRQETGSWKETIGLFAKSIVSWQSLLLVGVTLAVAFADSIGKAVGSWFGYSEATEKAAKKQKQLNEEMSATLDNLNEVGLDIISNTEIQIVQLKKYYDVASDVNETDKDRANALKAINEISPEYLGNLTMENIATQEAADSILQYTLRLRDLARAQAVFEQYKSLNKELVKQEQNTGKLRYSRLLYGTNSEKESELNEREKYGAMQSARMAMANSKYFNDQEDAYDYYLTAAIQARIDAIDKNLEPLRSKLQELEMYIDPAFIYSGADDGKKTPGVKAPKKAKEEKDTRLQDGLAHIRVQLEIELQEAERNHKIRLQSLGSNNAIIENEEKRHQDEILDLKLHSMRMQISIMEAMRNTLTNAELDQLALLQAQYNNLAVTIAKNKFLLGDSGLKSTDSDKPKEKKVDPKKAIQDTIKATQQLAQAIDQLLIKDEQRRQTQLQRQIDQTKRRQDELKMLAALGAKDAKDNLALEERRQAELERKQDRIQKAAAKRQLAIAALNAYSSKTSRGEQNATATTISDIATLLSFVSAASFYEGTEDTGKVDKALDSKGGRIAILHDNERVLSKEDNAMIDPSLKNRDLAMLAFTYKMGKPINADVNNSEIVEKLSSIEQAVKNQEPASWSWSDIDKAVEYKYNLGNKTVREMHKVGGVWGGRS